MEPNAARLSNLPDEIAVKILGHLPTKSVLATVVLVRQWYNQQLWRELPDLDLDQSLVFDEGEDDEDNDERLERFTRFVDRILTLARVPIRRFKISTYAVEPVDIIRWVREGVRLNAAEIEILTDRDRDVPIMLPRSLFASNSLLALKIDSHVTVGIPLPENCFFALKKLDISTHFTHEDPVANHLFCNGLVLEDVRINGTIDEESQVTFRVMLPMLKTLSIQLESIADDEDLLFTPRAILNIPKAEQISLSHDFLVSYTLVDFPNLITADIDVNFCSAKYDDFDDTSLVHNLVNGLPAVHNLRLSSSTRSALVIAFTQEKTLPAFPNLTQLEMGFSHCCGWRFLGTLFRDSPVLERIILKKEESHPGQPHQNAIAWERPSFLPVLLQELQLLDFNGLNEVMTLVQYFVEDATLLKLTVGAHGWSDQDKLALLSWSSGRDCEVKFV